MLYNQYIISIGLLFLSSTIMIIAWYAHLKHSNSAIWQAILVSWFIAFFEYLLQVPANRIGYKVMSTAQLRVIAEFFILVSFVLLELFILHFRGLFLRI
ncbi:DMT family protein [Spirobacillus cienkowskii]